MKCLLAACLLDLSGEGCSDYIICAFLPFFIAKVFGPPITSFMVHIAKMSCSHDCTEQNGTEHTEAHPRTIYIEVTSFVVLPLLTLTQPGCPHTCGPGGLGVWGVSDAWAVGRSVNLGMEQGGGWFGLVLFES